MVSLDDRVVIVTGAGRGMGFEHAKLLAAAGAAVILNDVGCDRDGSGSDPSIAETAAEAIRSTGGIAVANSADVSTTGGAREVVDLAVAEFGALHGLVNNAGILRDRMFVNMTDDDWDEVMRGHLRATFAPTRAAAQYWRDRSKAGDPVRGSIVSMSSTSGLIGAVGQSNYGAAKAGIAAMTVILAQELGRYGVRVNALHAGCADAHDRGGARRQRPRARPRRRQLRHLPPAQRVTAGAVAAVGRLPGDRRGVLRPGTRDPPLRAVAVLGHDHHRRSVGSGRHRRTSRPGGDRRQDVMAGRRAMTPRPETIPLDVTGRPLALRSLDLDRFFHPRRVAVVGAGDTPGRPNTGIWKRLVVWGDEVGAEVIPVNPTRPTVDGRTSYPSLLGIDGSVDLAVILVADAERSAARGDRGGRRIRRRLQRRVRRAGCRRERGPGPARRAGRGQRSPPPRTEHQPQRVRVVPRPTCRARRSP